MAFGVLFQRRQLVLLTGDVLFAVLAMWLGHGLRFGFDAESAGMWRILVYTTGASFFFVATHVLLLYLADAYETIRDYRQPDEVVRLWMAAAGALVLQMAIFYALPNYWWGRGVAVLSALSFAVMLTWWRLAFSTLRPEPVVQERTLVVGAGRTGQAMASVITSHHEYGHVYDLVGYIDDAAPEPLGGLPVLGGGGDMVEICRQHRVGLLVVAVRGGMSQTMTKGLLECKASGVRIEDMPSLYKRLTGKVPIMHLADTWLIFGPAFSGNSRLGALSIRAADVVLALIGLALTWPIILLAAMLVRLESPGGSFYTQERLGLGEQPFTIIKLRTMRHDAEKGTGAVWSTGAGDPRVTRIGRWLRRSRIDELPQFVNVLRGDMAFIGPRPERKAFVDQLKEQVPFYGLRFAVKPGLTGWAQVMYRYGASQEDAAEKLRYELFAIQEMGPVLYVLILLKTVQTVLLRPGS